MEELKYALWITTAAANGGFAAYQWLEKSKFMGFIFALLSATMSALIFANFIERT